MSNAHGKDWDAIGLMIIDYLSHVGIVLWASILASDALSGDGRGVISALAAIGMLAIMPRAMRSGFHAIDRWRDRMLARLEEEHERK